MFLSMSNLIDNEELNGDYVETKVRPYGGTAGKKYIGNLTANSTIEYKTNIAKSGKYRLDVDAVAGNSNSNRILTVYLDDKELAKVPVVSKNGVTQAKGKGKCLVYVYAQYGIYKKIKVKVLK
jgi:hypothetical protein